MGGWDQNGPLRDWLGECGVDSSGSGLGTLAGCCECGDEPSGSGATDLVMLHNNDLGPHWCRSYLTNCCAKVETALIAGRYC
jgi:hypothetical protein